MKYFNQLPITVQGILWIIAGMIILLDTMGFATQIVHTIVLCGSIGLIVWGIILADISGKIYRLFKKDNNPGQPKPPLES